MNLSVELLKQTLLRKSFKFFEGGDFNLNMVGIRNTRAVHANSFNDIFCVAFSVRGQVKLLQYACTTDPGTYYRTNPINPLGTAILPLGQHFGLWQIGLHQGKYPALVQRNAVGVIRDNNRDNALDFNGPLDVGMHGINCHRAREHGASVQVDKWSAGCQVIASGADFSELMRVARRAADIHGNGFTYTLIEDRDLE
jgi:hypothetical protein